MLLLMILDGFGNAPASNSNAISLAKKPNIDRLFNNYPLTEIGASGLSVGLPEGQMGNSEVGHLNIGAGRVVYQEITRIDQAIDDREFSENTVLRNSMRKAVASGNSVHLFGLLSDGGVHSSLKHIDALLKMAVKEKVEKLYLHAFMDGRDTSPTSGVDFVKQQVAKLKDAGIGKIATLMGRYWGMDRDKRWDRVEKAYLAIINRQTKFSSNDPVQAVKDSYHNDITDEFIEPIIFDSDDRCEFKSGDSCIFFNFRADRVRELTSILVKKTESTFAHPEGPDLDVVSLTLYDEKVPLPIAFPKQKLSQIFPAILAENGKRFLKIAETEKYPHVTYFFNGGEEVCYPGEERELINSPKVATYDLQPEMSAPLVAKKCADWIRSDKLDVVILNFANPDMVGHTGIIPAAVKAIEAVDTCVGTVISALEDVGGEALITADHGNAEQMVDPKTDNPFTAHTINPVPFCFYSKKNNLQLRSGGILADIAPTMLQLLDMNIPDKMSGKTLLI